MAGREAILSLYPEVGAHAREHAVKTADLASQIALRPEYSGLFDSKDLETIEACCLLHDIGYRGQRTYWSTTQWEHPYASLDGVDDALSDMDETRKAMAKLIILNHDSTNHSLPAFMGSAEILRRGFSEYYGVCSRTPGILADLSSTQITDGAYEQIPYDKFMLMLQVVQEADGLLGNPQRTLDFSVERGIKTAINDGYNLSIGIPMWQHSALANVVLAAKRAILDSYTREGQEAAWKMFTEARGLAIEHCGENVGEILRKSDVERLIWGHQTFGKRFIHNYRITQAYNLQGVFFIMPDGIPYRNLHSKLVPTEKLTSSNFFGVRKEEVRILARLREQMIRNYGHDILTETSGALRVIVDEAGGEIPNKEYLLMPPIMSAGDFIELTSTSRPWVDLAKQLSIPSIRVLLVG